MYSAWQYEWANVDHYGNNGSHDYVLGGLISIAIYSNSFNNSLLGGHGQPPVKASDIADVAGWVVGFAASGGSLQNRLDGANNLATVCSAIAGFFFD